MDLLNLFARTYALMHNYPHIPIWVFTPFRRLIRTTANKYLPLYLSKHKKYVKGSTNGIIVSFTSFPARINEVWMVVESIKRQSLLPEKIILWLSKEQFPTEESIPNSLLEEMGEIFQIRMVEGDVRSHKKYYYVAKEYPNSLIFLIDDDIYYPSDILKRSLKLRETHPNAVICNYGYHIGYDIDGNIFPYKRWHHEYNYSQKNDLFFGSGGGTLLKSSDLYKDLCDINLATKLCPLADDIWLNAMVRLSGNKIVLSKNGLILPIITKGDVKLATENVSEAQNDIQLRNLNNHYKNKIGKIVF